LGKLTLELNLERDTQNAPGTPDIVDTIFQKIKGCHIFVCDITLITSVSENKRCPNPNVLVELGYAASIVGWHNIICVYNEAHGSVEELPFDLRFRRPLIYNLQEVNINEKSTIKERLIKVLEEAIRQANPESVETRNKIVKEFQNESVKARQLVIDKPKFWEFKLLEELLRTKISEVQKQYQNLERGLTFRRMSRLTTEEFSNWISIMCSDLQNLMKYFTGAVLKELNNCQGEPGVAGNPFEIKFAVDKIVEGCDKLLEWEIELKFFDVPNHFKEIQKDMLGWTYPIIETFLKLPDELKGVYSRDLSSEKEIHINLKFEASQRFSDAIPKITKLNSQAHILRDNYN
jgi:hypothetical protein